MTPIDRVRAIAALEGDYTVEPAEGRLIVVRDRNGYARFSAEGHIAHLLGLLEYGVGCAGEDLARAEAYGELDTLDHARDRLADAERRLREGRALAGVAT